MNGGCVGGGPERAEPGDTGPVSPDGSGRAVNAPLDERALRSYREDGLAVSPVRLPSHRLEEMRGALDGLLAANADIAPESLVCPHIPNGARHDAAAAQRWLSFALDPLLVDAVAQILGPDVILWGSQVFCKPAATGREVPWHQDGQYWPIRPVATCSVWIALDDATPKNGCMRYIAGSHHAGSLFRHRERPGRDVVLNQEVEAADLDLARARDDVLEAGQFSLHDVFLIHGSGPNRSGVRRAAFVVRFMPAPSLFDRRIDRRQDQAGVSFSFSRRPLWLARGADRAGNDFSIGHGEEMGLVPRVSDDA
ncbi:MAG: phytanoyl-CoA dioxygenase family protein [Betaproteobacteria bacterium]|nr:phytanoyl-CoA dioxygenase family protein [Betaproteobacteria bacterium]